VANAEPSCPERVKKCEEVLKSATETIKVQDLLIEAQDTKITIQDQQLTQTYKLLQDERERADAWYHDPALLIPTSFLLGFVAASLLKK